MPTWTYAETAHKRQAKAALLDIQGGRCAGCLSRPEPRWLCLDHDHSTGYVRGLLCGACNMHERKIAWDWDGYVSHPPASLTRDECLTWFVTIAEDARRKATEALVQHWAVGLSVAINRTIRNEVDRRKRAVSVDDLRAYAERRREFGSLLNRLMSSAEVSVAFSDPEAAHLLNVDLSVVRAPMLRALRDSLEHRWERNAPGLGRDPLPHGFEERLVAAADVVAPHDYEQGSSGERRCGFEGCPFDIDGHPPPVEHLIAGVAALTSRLEEVRDEHAAL